MKNWGLSLNIKDDCTMYSNGLIQLGLILVAKIGQRITMSMERRLFYFSLLDHISAMFSQALNSFGAGVIKRRHGFF